MKSNMMLPLKQWKKAKKDSKRKLRAAKILLGVGLEEMEDCNHKRHSLEMKRPGAAQNSTTR